MKLYTPMKIFRVLNTCFQIYSYASLFVPERNYKFIERIFKKNVELSEQDLQNNFVKGFEVHSCKNLKRIPSKNLHKHKYPKYNEYLVQCVDTIEDDRENDIYMLFPDKDL
jgi:hypothetical protein